MEEGFRDELGESPRSIAPRNRTVPLAQSRESRSSVWQEQGGWSVEQKSEDTQKACEALLRYWRLIAGCAVLFLVIAGLYAVCATRLYTSEATLRIESYAPLIAGAEVENVLRQQSMEQSYEKTQVAALSGLSIADRVLSDPELGPRIKRYSADLRRGIALFRSRKLEADRIPEGYHHPVSQLKAYLKLIKISPVRDTALVGVKAETRDPELSRAIANAHGEAFVEELRALRHKAISQNSRFLADQAADLEQKVADAERRVARYAQENRLFALANEQELLTRKIKTLTEQHAKVMGERIRLGSLVEEVRGGSGLDSTIIDDESIRSLRTTLEGAEADYAHLRTRFTAQYPPAAQALARVMSLRRTIAQQRSQAVAALTAKYASVVQSETSLGEQIERQKTLDHETSRRLVEYNTLQREYDSVRDLHQTVLRQLKEMQIAAAGTSSNVIITERAVAATEPSTPRVGAVLIIGTILGVMVGAAIALLRQLFDTTIHAVEEISSCFGVVPFGSIPQFEWNEHEGREFRSLLAGCMSRIQRVGFSPHLLSSSAKIRQEEDAVESVELAAIDKPASSIAEAFRTIRTALLLSSADAPPRTVLITSSQKDEGKTTVASNLAIVLAQAGQRTLLIDTDIRSPSIAKRFVSERRTGGLVEYLTGHLPLDEVLQETAVPRLWVLSAGIAAPNPAELVGSRKMAELVKLLSRRFDQVILDSPPLLPFSDSLMMSHFVDGVLLVVRSEKSERGAIREALDRLRSVHAPLLGVVMNGVRMERTAWSAYTDYYKELPDLQRA